MSLIYKQWSRLSGNHSIISYYRQISVQSHITKIFKTHKIIIEEHHDFCCGRSTTTSNLVFSNITVYL